MSQEHTPEESLMTVEELRWVDRDLECYGAVKESTRKRLLSRVLARGDRQSRIYVYLVGNVEHNMYKIGVSYDPEKRIKQLNAPFILSVLKTCPLWFHAGHSLLKRARTLETKLHEYYIRERKRLRNEWFRDIDPMEFDLKALEFWDEQSFEAGAYTDLCAGDLRFAGEQERY